MKLIRLISGIFPLKHKLNFLIRRYLGKGTSLAIAYCDDKFICTTVSDDNRSTTEDLILMGVNGLPEYSLISKIKPLLPDGMVVIDVGGNIGTFLWQFERKSSSIIVFEPIPALNKVIQQSVIYNNSNKVRLISKAVGDTPGNVKMLNNNNSSVVSGEAGADMLNIEITTLDKELAACERIDLIKIDVEGYEVNVLRGAREVILKHKPVILVEVHPVYLENYDLHHKDVIGLLESYGYIIRYFSFLEEQRMNKFQRIISRWGGNKGVEFTDKNAFLADVDKEPPLSSYHFYCVPG